MTEFTFHVDDLALAQTLRTDRLLTSSLRFEPTFKHDDPDDDPEVGLVAEDEDSGAAKKSAQPTKKQRKAAQFSFEQLLPLRLTAEEALLAVDQKRIHFQPVSKRVIRCVAGPAAQEQADFRVWAAQIRVQARFAVLSRLWAEGMTLVDGLKFGVDFLAYSKDPTRFHADYMVLAAYAEAEELTSLDLVALVNVAAKARKTLLFANVIQSAGAKPDVQFLALHRRPVVASRTKSAGKAPVVRSGACISEEELLDRIPQ